MMPSLKSLLFTTLVGATAVSALPTTSTTTVSVRAEGKNFSGKGQLRTTLYKDDYADLGCLTSQGLWTANESLCGTFTATPVGEYRDYTLSTSEGECYINHVSFRCGGKSADNTYVYFGIFPTQPQIGGGEALRFGQYGLMGGADKYPPGPNDAPTPVQFWSSKDLGQQMVWLTWKAL